MSRCGTCRFAEAIKNDLASITCYGTPPTPVMMPVRVATPEGIKLDMQIQLLRPGLLRTERACALYQPAELPVYGRSPSEMALPDADAEVPE